MSRPTVSVARVSSTLASSTLIPPTMACQVLKNRKRAGELMLHLQQRIEKVLQDVAAGKHTAVGAKKAVEDAHTVALEQHATVIGNGAG